VDSQLVLLVLRACDGISTAPLFEGHQDARELAETQELLLRLTRVTGPLIDLP
jgi:hypothetical protein